MRGGNLKATADGERQAFPEMEPAKHETRSQVDLSFAGVRAVLEIGVVDFEFGPELAVEVILKSVVPGIGAANFGFIAGGKRCAERALQIEVAEAFAVSDGGSDDGVGGAVGVLPGRQGGLEESSEDVIAVLLVGGEDAVLHKKTPVAEPVLNRWAV